MKIDFALDKEDICRYIVYASIHNPQPKAKLFFAIAMVEGVLAVCGLIVYFTNYNSSHPLQPWFPWVSGGLILYALFYLFRRTSLFIRWYAGKQIAADPAIVGKRQITASPEWFNVQTPLLEAKLRWLHIKEIVKNGNDIYFITQKRLAHIIPAIAFTDPATREEFLQEATTYWQAGKDDRPLIVNHANAEPTDWPPAPQIGRE